jgi:hypothetical protein
MIVVGGRDAADRKDRFTALDRRTGRPLWLHEYDAPAELDYGNSPRATPVLIEGIVVTLGATGVLSALDATTGVSLWSVDLAKRFSTPVPTWGFSGSPLVIDRVIYLQVGEQAAVVAIDLFSGDTKWQVAGQTSAYSSLMPLADQPLIVGVQPNGYFVRRIKDGTQVWGYTSEFSGDFGVPAAVPTQHGVVFTSENNGIQLIGRQGETLQRTPDAINDTLIPDSHTPVLVGSQLLVAYDGLHALNVDQGLQETWSVAESSIIGYASIIAAKNRALVTTEHGVLLLVEFDEASAKVVDQRQIAKSNVALLSHPMVVGKQLVMRVGDQIRCYALSSK